MKFHPKNLIKQGVLLLILIISFLLPRGLSIGQFVAVDEVNWLHRSAKFYDAIVKHNWGETYVNNSPGVITTWVGALAFKIAAPNYKVHQDLKKNTYTTFQNDLVWKVGVQPLYVLVVSRVIMISLLMIVLILCYFYAQKLFGVLPSFIGFLIIALDPFFIALTRMSHLDAPQAVFMFLSLLAFINYLFHGNRRFDLVISGIAGGLAFLSKLPGIFIIPTIGFVALWDYLRTRSINKAGYSSFADQSFKKLILSLLTWALVFMLAYSAFWPSMWVQPIKTVGKVFNTSSKYTSTIVEENKSEQGDQIINEQEEEADFSSPQTYKNYLRYPGTFLWRTTPIVLLGLILLLITYLLRKDQGIDESVWKGVQGLLILIVVYTIGITLPTKSSEKYYAPAYLALDLLAGIGWYFFVFILTNKFRSEHKKYIRPAILIAVIVTQSIWVYQSYPYYFTHYNPLMGGLRRAAQVRFIGVGEGLDQAGLYLIKKPDSSQLNVMAWYGVGPLSYFFNGKVTPLYMSNSVWMPEFIQKLRTMDYLVTYTNQKSRNQPPELFDILSGIPPENTITINGVEYAWIYKVSDIPLPEPEP